MNGCRAGLLTFHRSVNYGSVLQAYALVQVLKEMHLAVEVVDYWPEVQDALYGLYEPATSWRAVAKNARTLAFHTVLSSRIEGFRAFRDNHLPLSAQKQAEAVDTQSVCERYDLIVCGSDQIWNVNARDFSEVFLLPFPECIAKIAYGPSLNNGDFRGGAHERRYRELLLNFDALSVREDSGREKLDALLCGTREISVVADPTLLLDREHYLRLSSMPRPRRPYVFLYTVKHSSVVIEAAMRTAATLGVPVVTLFTGSGTYRTLITGGGRILLSTDSSPEDFLGLMENAQYVVTDSFHGTAFSILLQKPFCVPQDADRVERGLRDTRIRSLLDRVGLRERAEGSPADLARTPIDFSSVEQRRRAYAEGSRAYLREAISVGLARAEGRLA